MVELAERLGSSDTYGILNPYLINDREGDYNQREAVLRARLDEGDKKLYLLPYWIG